MCSRIASSSGVRSFVGLRQSVLIQLFFAEPNITGKSSCSSVASSENIRSNTISCTSSGRQLGLSTLFTTTIGFKPICNAFCNTKRVWGIGPSKASTRSMQPSAILSTRSTSPPKSLCPGVSIMLIFVPLYCIDTFFDRMVIPLSLSRSLLSSVRLSLSCSLSRLPASIILSTKVVFPWSTCAIMAMLRIFCIIVRYLYTLLGCKVTTKQWKKRINTR